MQRSMWVVVLLVAGVFGGRADAQSWRLKNTGTDSSGAAKMECVEGVPDDGCHKCDCGGGSGGSPGSGGGQNCSVAISVSAGSLRPGTVMQDGVLRIKADVPSSTILSPQGLQFALASCLYSISAQTNASGASKEVTILGQSCDPITYLFADNTTVGEPQGKFSGILDRLHMLDAVGQAVSNHPEYYELWKSTGAKFRYGANPTNNEYRGLIRVELPTGRVSTWADGGVKVIRDEAQSLRQVSMPQCLVDIVMLTNTAYEMRFYKPSEKGAWNTTTGLFEPINTPFKTWRIEDGDTDPNTFDKIKVLEIANGATNTILYEWTDASASWKLTQLGGLVVDTRDKVWDDSHEYRWDGHVVKAGAAGPKAIEERKKYYVYPFGERVIEEHVGGTEAPLITHSTYYENAVETGRYSRLRSTVKPTGAWEKYDWHVNGYVASRVLPYKDAAVDAPTNACVLERYAYEPLDTSDDLSFDPDSPRTVTREIQGVVVSKTLSVFSIDAEGQRTEIQEQCTRADAVFGDTNSLRTTKIYWGANASDAAKGWIKQERKPDGTLASYDYEFGTYYASTSPAVCRFEPDGIGTAYRKTIVYGVMGRTNGIPYKTLKTTEVKDEVDNTVLEETYVYTGGTNYARIAWIVREYDFQSHPVKEYRSDGTELNSTWSTCCGKDSETLADGTEKAYEYDSLNRLITETKIGTNSAGDVLTEYTYDAANRRLSETRSAGGLSLANRNGYDLAGRLTNSVDSTGVATRYEYENGGLTKRTSRAGVTNVTEKYLDDRTKSIAQNGILKTFYDYGVNADGSQWTKVYTGPAGTNSPMWTKTTTDMLGRTVKEEKPGFGGTTLATVHVYDSVGHLVSVATKNEEPGTTNVLSVTLCEHDELGNQTRSGIDVNTNGVLDLAGPDRVAESQTFYQSDASSNLWQVRASVLYAGGNSAAPTTNSVQRTRLTGLGSCSGNVLLTAESYSIDILGHPTALRLFLHRAAKTVTQVVTYPDSTTNAEQRTVNGLLVVEVTRAGVRTEYAYDALGRRTSAQSSSGTGLLSPRRNATVRHYNALGQADWIEDGASNRTTTVYDSATGRRSAMTDALSNTTYAVYDGDGRVMAAWGATYPVAYVHDELGRMSEMHTYRGSTEVAMYSQLTNLQSQMDRTTFSYDLATGLLTNKLYADNKGPAYTYTTDGRLSSRTWARGVTTTYGYDALGQLTNIDYSDSTPDVTFTYDRMGHQMTITDGQGTHTRAYDDALHLTSEETLPAIPGSERKQIGRLYDTLGRPAGYNVYIGGTTFVASVRYTYDHLGRFSTLTTKNQETGTTNTFSYSYFPNSDLIVGLTETNSGFTIIRRYEDHRDLITHIINMSGTNVISQFDYENDALGRRITRFDYGAGVPSPRTNTFGYNLRSELTEAVMGTNTHGYTYDPIGNRQTSTKNAEQSTYSANALNQYTNISDGVTNAPTYDLDGNMLTYNGWTFAWDAENRLILASNATVMVSNAYDYMSRRIGKSVFTNDSGSWCLTSDSSFAYDGWNLISEITKNKELGVTNHNSYVWGLDLSGSSQGAGGIGALLSASFGGTTSVASVFYAFDGNGNVSELVDAAAPTNVLAHYEYDPYGNTIAVSGAMALGNPFRFSTKYLDAEVCRSGGGQGLYYYGLRYYEPTTGRWLKRDLAGEAWGANLYLFAENDSVKRVDKLGLFDIPGLPKGFPTDIHFPCPDAPEPPEYETWVLVSHQSGDAFFDGPLSNIPVSGTCSESEAGQKRTWYVDVGADDDFLHNSSGSEYTRTEFSMVRYYHIYERDDATCQCTCPKMQGGGTSSFKDCSWNVQQGNGERFLREKYWEEDIYKRGHPPCA